MSDEEGKMTSAESLMQSTEEKCGVYLRYSKADKLDVDARFLLSTNGDAFFEHLRWKKFVTILQMLYSLDMSEHMYIFPTPLFNMRKSFPLSHANSIPPTQTHCS